jgi:hypothetical protein
MLGQRLARVDQTLATVYFPNLESLFERTKREFGFRIPVLDRLAVPLDSLGGALWHSETLLIQPSQLEFGFGIAMRCRCRIPLEGFRIVLRDSSTLFVQFSHFVFGFFLTVLRRL